MMRAFRKSLCISNLVLSLDWVVCTTAFSRAPTPSLPNTRQVQKSPSQIHYTNGRTKDYSASLSATGSSVRDSWALVVLGDLHLEDDLTSHNQARQDCIEALQELSILVPSSSPTPPNDPDSPGMITLKERVEELRTVPAGDLDVADLEALLAYQKASKSMGEGQEPLCQSYMVSLGDLGRKEYVCFCLSESGCLRLLSSNNGL